MTISFCAVYTVIMVMMVIMVMCILDVHEFSITHILPFRSGTRRSSRARQARSDGRVAREEFSMHRLEAKYVAIILILNALRRRLVLGKCHDLPAMITKTVHNSEQ